MPEVSKVILDGVTLMDVTQDTVNPSNTLTGFTGHKNDGASFTGNYTPMGMTITDVVEQDGGTVRTITGTEISGTKQITENGTHDVSSYAFADVNVSGGAATPHFATLRVTNTRTSGTTAQKSVAFNNISFYETGNQNCPDNSICTINSNVTSGATTDISIPYVRASSYFFDMRTQSSALTPTTTSNYVTLVGHYVSGSIRHTVLKLESGHPAIVEMTVGEEAE